MKQNTDDKIGKMFSGTQQKKKENEKEALSIMIRIL
jgi:hypothetical protein